MRRLIRILLVLCFAAASAYAADTITAGTVLEGFVLDKKERKYPMVVTIAAVDNATGKLEGNVSWTSLNSVHRIEGRVEGNRLTFKEVSYIKRGSAHLNCEYALVLDGGSLEGSWAEPGVDRGAVRLKIR